MMHIPLHDVKSTNHYYRVGIDKCVELGVHLLRTNAAFGQENNKLPTDAGWQDNPPLTHQDVAADWGGGQITIKQKKDNGEVRECSSRGRQRRYGSIPARSVLDDGGTALIVIDVDCDTRHKEVQSDLQKVVSRAGEPLVKLGSRSAGHRHLVYLVKGRAECLQGFTKTNGIQEGACKYDLLYDRCYIILWGNNPDTLAEAIKGRDGKGWMNEGFIKEVRGAKSREVVTSEVRPAVGVGGGLEGDVLVERLKLMPAFQALESSSEGNRHTAFVDAASAFACARVPREVTERELLPIAGSKGYPEKDALRDLDTQYQWSASQPTAHYNLAKERRESAAPDSYDEPDPAPQVPETRELAAVVGDAKAMLEDCSEVVDNYRRPDLPLQGKSEDINVCVSGNKAAVVEAFSTTHQKLAGHSEHFGLYGSEDHKGCVVIRADDKRIVSLTTNDVVEMTSLLARYVDAKSYYDKETGELRAKPIYYKTIRQAGLLIDAHHYINRRWNKMPRVLAPGMTTKPYLRDGRWVFLPGQYDPDVRLFHQYEASEYRAIPAYEEAAHLVGIAALLLDDLIAGFPFRDTNHRAMLIAFWLACVLRDDLGGGEMPFVQISQVGGREKEGGTGKTSLVETGEFLRMGRLGGGAKIAPDKPYEVALAIGKATQDGHTFFHFDNWTRAIEGGKLSALITDPNGNVHLRAQGHAGSYNNPRSVYVSTGNHLGIDPDLLRRTAYVQLVAPLSSAGERLFQWKYKDIVFGGDPSVRLAVRAALMTIAAHFRQQDPDVIAKYTGAAKATKTRLQAFPRFVELAIAPILWVRETAAMPNLQSRWGNPLLTDKHLEKATGSRTKLERALFIIAHYQEQAGQQESGSTAEQIAKGMDEGDWHELVELSRPEGRTQSKTANPPMVMRSLAKMCGRHHHGGYRLRKEATKRQNVYIVEQVAR